MNETIEEIKYESGGYFYRLKIDEKDVTHNADLAAATGLSEEHIRTFFQLHNCLKGADSYLIHAEQPIDLILNSLMNLVRIQKLAGRMGVNQALQHLRLTK